VAKGISIIAKANDACGQRTKQVHQVPLCLDMCAMQKPQTFKRTMPSQEAITVLSLI
jgi:hypothetical protein